MALALVRAQAIAEAHALTVQDVEMLTPSFWNLHTDHVMALDTAAATLITIQMNLLAQTPNPSIQRLLEDILAFRVQHLTAHYCLTEVAHGLDAINIETTATALPSGGFELHTPHPGAAKIMPPTSPFGIPAVGVVLAKLIVEGQDHGIRPFVLKVKRRPSDGTGLLPPRDGSSPVYHSITILNKVLLPADALLGTVGKRAEDKMAARINHTNTIWRTAVGALALGGPCITDLHRSAFIAGRYSQRRTVGLPDGSRGLIISFRTQHAPILVALFYKVACMNFADQTLDMGVRYAWSTVFKVTAVDHARTANLELSQRCGAQGLFMYNEIFSMHTALQGISIAEGDVLGISIRLVSELLQGCYELPKSTNPTSPLALHEHGLLTENQALLTRIGGHRKAEFNNLIAPKSEGIVRAVGHRMAYDAAVNAGLDPRITSLFLATAITFDPAWYSEKMGFKQDAQAAKENEAISAALPCLDEWLDQTGVERCAQVPILSEANWDTFIQDSKVVFNLYFEFITIGGGRNILASVFPAIIYTRSQQSLDR
ncbi:hypothetical protein B0H17DRAFT_1302600 [Mycena rosella]|uniref:Acyl-CoA dehydrogenase NM domain-like protein n=1 Tax=Mycena rosella TaxID=1033263 RepID=A0AAD7DC43_MYCRO|nr:hypothetical protein B0H17DRAFT_1302600 [Mycena rosella]